MNKVKFAKNDVYNFLLSFDDKIVAKIFGYLELLDELGYLLKPPKSRKIAENLYELRVLGNLSIRIFYTFYRGEIFILHAFVKKSQKIPKRELDKVINILKYLH
jgi:phage-related protein